MNGTICLSSNQIRLCIDCRILNSNIPCDGHQLLRLNEKTFCQCHVFFKLDLFELLVSAAFVIEEWSPLTSTNS